MNQLARRPGPWVDRGRLALWTALVLVLLWPRVAGFTTDSDAYIDVAGNVRAGHGFVQTVVDFWRPTLPDPLGLWPPLYPAAIALVSLFGLPAPEAARAVAAVAFVAFAVAFHALARRAGGRGFAFVVTLVAVLHPAVLLAGATAWSESLYLALATAAMALVVPAPASPAPSLRRHLLAGALLGLAADARYLGLVLAPVAAVFLLRSRAPRRAVAAFAGAALLVAAPWLGRNLAVFGRPFGPPLPHGSLGPGEALRALLAAARWEFLPAPLAGVAPLALLALVAVGTGVCVACLRRDGAGWAAWCALAQLAAVLFAVVRFGINDPAGRYTLVAWPFVALAAGASLAAALRRTRDEKRRARAEIAASGLVLFLAAAALGRSFAARPVPSPAVHERAVALAALARLTPKDAGPVLSDAGHRWRIATGRAAVQVPPQRFRPRDFGPADEARWRAQGVRYAVLDTASRAALGAWLARRTSPGGGWALEDSSGGFARWRMDSGPP